jgi:hypothetical protein
MKFTKSISEIESKEIRLTKPIAGGYILKCIKVELIKSKEKQEMIILYFDIDEGTHEGYFKKYPLRFYNLYQDDTFISYFKALLTYFKNSNPESLKESDLQGDSFDERKLIGLKIGAVLREEEYSNKNGEVRSSLKIFYFRSIDSIKNTEPHTPDKKTLDSSAIQILNKNLPEDDCPF